MDLKLTQDESEMDQNK